MDFLTKCEIESTFRRLNEILASGIFAPQNGGHIFVQSAFIETLIRLRDLMFKTEQYSSRISFTDDVVTSAKVNDVTDLIKFVRDALCHPESENHYIDVANQIKATYNVAYGKGALLSIGTAAQASDYDDDVCFFFGLQKIYLHRHIIRAFDEAKQKLSPLL